VGVDHEVGIPLGDDFHAGLILEGHQRYKIAIHVESIVIGSAVYGIVLYVLAVSTGNRPGALFDGGQMALASVGVLQGIDDGNDLIQEGFRSFVGSGHKLIGKLHGRVGAGKLVAVDAVCHESRCRMALEEFSPLLGV